MKHKAKKLLSIILALVMFAGLLPTVAFAKEGPTGGSFNGYYELIDNQEYYYADEYWVTYDISGGNCTIKQFNSSVDHPRYIIIPEKIEGFTVTAIGDNAFNGANLLGVKWENGEDHPVKTLGASAFRANHFDEFVVPKGVTSLGIECFKECQRLKSIDLRRHSLRKIPDRCFFGNSGMTSAFLPENGTLKIIGTEAFYNTSHITELKIPAGVTTINASALTGQGPKKVNLEAYAPGVFSIRSWYNTANVEVIWGDYNEDGAFVSNRFENAQDGDVDAAGNSVYGKTSTSCLLVNTETGRVCGLKSDYNTNSAYTDYDSATGKVTLNEVIDGVTITRITPGAFQNKYSTYDEAFKEIDIKAPLTVIDSYAFGSCTYLAKITFPDTVEAIGSFTFDRCPVTELTFPESLKTLGPHNGNEKLKTVTFKGDKVTTIDSEAFRLSPSLTDLYIQNMYDPANAAGTPAGPAGAPWGASTASVHWKDGSALSDYIIDDTGLWLYNQSTGTILRYLGNNEDNGATLVIPSQLTKTVNVSSVTTNIVQLGEPKVGALNYNLGTNLAFDRVIIPPTIQIIEEFFRNKERKDDGSVTIKELVFQTIPGIEPKLSKIGLCAFYGCGIDTISPLPSSLINIERAAFASNKFTTITLPGNLTEVGKFAFQGTPLTEIMMDFYSITESDTNTAGNPVYDPANGLYKKVPASILGADFGSANGINLNTVRVWRDDAQARPKFEAKSNAVLNSDNTDNTATLYIHGYTNNPFYVVRDIESATAGLPDVDVTFLAPNQGDRKATKGETTISADGTYEFDLYYNMTIQGTEENTYKARKYSTTTDAFHTVTYDLAAAEAVYANVRVSGSASDKGGSDHGYVEAYGVLTDDGSNVTLNSTSGYQYQLVGWRDKTDASITAAKNDKISMPDRDVVLIPILRNTHGDAKEITFNANGGSIIYLGNGNSPTGSIYADQLLTESDIYNAMTVSREGYRLAGWSTDSGANNTVNIVSYPTGTDSLTVYAVWQIKDDVTVIFDANGGKIGDGVTCVAGPGTYGDDMTVPTATRPGYTFTGWNTKSDGNGNTVLTAGTTPTYPAEDAIYYATWAPKEQEVSFVCGGNGKFSDDTTAKKTYNVETGALIGTAVNPIPEVKANPGWSFDGWSDDTGIYAPDLISVMKVPAGGVTFTAQYTQNGKTAIIYNYNGGTDGSNSFSKWEAPAGSAFTDSLPTPTRTGYTLIAPTKPTAFPDEGVTVLVAEWTPITYKVRFNSNGGTGSISDQTIRYDEITSLTANTKITKTGSTFMGWATTESKANDGTVEYADGAKVINLKDTADAVFNLYAVWSADEYGITYDYDGGSVSNSNPDKAYAGDDVTLTEPTKTGYTFDGWTFDPIVTTTNNGFEMPAENVKVTATWTANRNTVKFEAQTGATVTTTPASITVQSGNAVGVKPNATAIAGYKVGDPVLWACSEGGIYTSDEVEAYVISGENNEVTFTAQATFTTPAGPFTVTFVTDGNCKMDPASYSESVVGGASVTTVPSVTANANYEFIGWSLNGVIYTSDAAVKSVKITADSTFVATCVKITTGGGGGGGGIITQYTLTYQTNGSSAIAATKHNSGATVSLTATPTREGYTFDGWYSDAALTSKITSVKMDGDKTVYAGWKETGSVTPGHDCPDVDINAWYHEYVDYVVKKGLMQGVADDLFAPNVTTSRAMIVTILYRLEGKPAVSGASPFDDVASGQWYADAVIWAEANEIVEGYGNGKFGPSGLITREQFAAIMYRYANFKGYDTSVGQDTNILSYDDVSDVSGWAMEAMQWAVGSGLISGRTTSTLVPKGDATRAETAAILKRFIENVK